MSPVEANEKMMRILILTSLYTGHGHKSVSDALTERLERYEDVEVLAVDGFGLMNKLGQYMAEYTYGPITRMPGRAWEWNYAAGEKLQKPVTRLVASMIRAKLLSLLAEFRPDVIVSLHPMFIGAVLDVLEDAGLRIPVIAHEVDLVDIADYWFDPRVDLTLAPSRESFEYTVARGVPAGRVAQVGFPVRRRFIEAQPKPHEGTVITVMSGAEGSGMLQTVTRVLLTHTDARVNVICGRNKKLRKQLKHRFARKYRGRVNIMGFVSNIEDVMASSDLLVMRASPNCVMEAVAMRVPVILFGRLAGQEQHNPEMLEAHGLARYCHDLSELPYRAKMLLSKGGAQAEAMRRAQRAYAPTDAAEQTAALIYNWVTEQSASERTG